MQTSIPVITYEQHEQSSIHEFTLYESSRVAVDQFFAGLNQITSVAIPDVTARYLIDSTESGTLPLRYLLPRINEWRIKHPNRPPSRTAVIYNPSHLMLVAENFIRTLRLSDNEHVHFFQSNHRDKAILWLLSDN